MGVPLRRRTDWRETPQPDQPDEFSLVVGGPFYQLLRRSYLCGTGMELWRRRLVLIPIFAWLPLLILSALGGQAWGPSATVPFLKDVEIHARFLVALPLLLLAELVSHQLIGPTVRQFSDRGLIPDRSRAKFNDAVASAHALRDSKVAEALILAAVYVVGIRYFFPTYAVLSGATWYEQPGAGAMRLTAAGRWFIYVSLPLFQFMLARWYFRLGIWTRFLWQVSRCELSLVPTHPDRMGGIGFLPFAVMAFAPLLAAHGVLGAGLIAERILFQGATALDFKVEIAATLGFLLMVVEGPMLLFTPHLARTNWGGLRAYGGLAQRYVREFDIKWLHGGAPAGEKLMGSADIQSLADLSNSYEIVRSMYLLPLSKAALLELTAVTLLPIAPLLLASVPLEEIAQRVLKFLF